MSDANAFSAPLELTEKARLPNGLMRVVLDIYPSGALSVELVPAARAGQHPAFQLSADMTEAKRLPRGEFAAAPKNSALRDALLRSGLFQATEKRLGEHEIWSLRGLAMIEFQSAFRPSLAASRVSFPAHLFEDKEFDSATQKHLVQRFESEGYTRHSARGASVWVIKQYCEKKMLPFTVYLLKEQEGVAGVLVCKRALAVDVKDRESGQGRIVEIVYESPSYST